MPRVRILLPLPKRKRVVLRLFFFLVCVNGLDSRHAERVEGCGSPVETSAKQKHRPSRQARTNPSAPAKCEKSERITVTVMCSDLLFFYHKQHSNRGRFAYKPSPYIFYPKNPLKSPPPVVLSSVCGSVLGGGP